MSISTLLANSGPGRLALWLRGIMAAGVVVICFMPTILLYRIAARSWMTLQERTDFVAERLAMTVVWHATLGLTLLAIHESVSWVARQRKSI